MHSSTFPNRMAGLALALAVMCASPAAAQGPARGPVVPARDPVMELEAKHNLEVAKFSLTKRKAYQGARDRLQEIIDTYPDFSRMDEVVYLLGEVHLKLGKPEVAADYFEKLLKVYPDSEFAKKAREQLKKLTTRAGQ
ncbi:MAG TPA: tetratricopeptide repeat protein [Blastocatellia bacterium]|nr:tetratricopeptide repeat protein [Blastocatellia bacterium]